MSLSFEPTVNPYAPPVAEDHAVLSQLEDEFQLAQPGTRLAAALIDGAAMVFPMAIVVGIYLAVAGTDDTDLMMGLAFLPLIPVGLAQLVMLSSRGQTIGKRAMGIKIVRADGREGGFWTFVIVRGWSVALIAGVIDVILPLKIGNLLLLADVLGVFTRDRRCLHDVFAKTRVVMAR